MSVRQHKLMISKSLIATLMFTWLSIFCQHCMALAEPEQTVSSAHHEHCVPLVESENETDLTQTCVSDCDELAAVHDTNNQQQNDQKAYKQSVLVSKFYPITFQKTPDTPIQESPPDQATFLPLEHYTVQLK